MDTKYQFEELLEVTERFYRQLKELHNGIPAKKQWDAQVIYRDYAIAFFIFCYHIKDWINKDDRIDKETKKKVKTFMRNSCLKNCAIIANGEKHLKSKPKHPKKSNAKSKITREETEILANGGDGYSNVIIKEFLYISTREGEIEVFNLASECINKWREFIEENIYKRREQDKSL
jgi:hypothetical protein